MSNKNAQRLIWAEFRSKGKVQDEDIPKFTGKPSVGIGAMFGGDATKIFVKFAMVSRFFPATTALRMTSSRATPP